MSDLRKHVQIWCLILSLVVMLSACGQPGKDEAVSIRQAPTTAPILEQQTCPAQGLARAANMPSRPAGGHPNLIYRSWHPGPDYPGGSDSVPLIGIAGGDLLRYDSVTAASTLILQESQIASVNVSPDGQWLLLVSAVQRSPVQNRERIQLIRIDGQHLQTLYCAPEDAYIGMVLFSPDQHALVFTQASQPRGNGDTYLLDVATGKLRLALSSDRSGFPSKKCVDCGILEPMKWATNNSVYFSNDSVDELANGIVGPPLGSDFYLLRDTSKDVSQQQSNLQRVVVSNNGKQCQYLDVTPDNRQLVCSTFSVGLEGVSDPGTLEVGAVPGGMLRPMYHSPAEKTIQARVISNTTLLFLQSHFLSGLNAPQPPDEEEVWKVNVDGSQPVKLITQANSGFLFDFADDMQPWSTVSRDGLLYDIAAGGRESIVVGSLSGGPSKTIPTPKGGMGIQPVGWAQL